MAKYDKVYLLNFGSRFNDNLLEQLKESVDADKVEQIHIKVNLDLSKNPYIQCHDIVARHKDILIGDKKFIVNLPGLPIACAFIINEITAITGVEPTIVFTSRDISKDGLFSEFKLKRLFNLNYEKTVTRERIKRSEY